MFLNVPYEIAAKYYKRQNNDYFALSDIILCLLSCKSYISSVYIDFILLKHIRILLNNVLNKLYYYYLTVNILSVSSLGKPAMP